MPGTACYQATWYKQQGLVSVAFPWPVGLSPHRTDGPANECPKSHPSPPQRNELLKSMWMGVWLAAKAPERQFSAVSDEVTVQSRQ